MSIEYFNLISAIAIIELCKREVWRTESDSPAWNMLRHASNNLKEQADAVLRGKEVR